MSSWKTLSRKTVLDGGKWVSVEMRTVQTPDGQVIDQWAWIKTPDFINVVPVTKEGNLLLFKQGKYGLDGLSLATVGGYIEPGEEPLPAAQRELKEEMGFASDQWINLGSYLVDPNRGVARGYLYLAMNVYPTDGKHADDLEAQELVELSPAEAEAALQEGQVKVMAWAASITMALKQLSSGGTR